MVFYYRGDFSQQKAVISYISVDGDSGNITQRVVEKSDGTLQIAFSIVQDNLRFNDALNMTREEFNELSSPDIQKMMLRRFQNWRIFTNQ